MVKRAWNSKHPLRSRRRGNRRGDVAGTITQSEKSLENDKHGTGSLVAREGSAAFERGGRCLYELVRADGSGKRAAGKRAAVGPDAVSQELDPGALCRARPDLLAG